MIDLPEADIDLALAALQRKELLNVRRDPLSPDRGRYTFAQALLRTVAYETLSKQERKVRHLRIAQYLRATLADGEDVAGAIAEHYREGWRAGADDPDSDDLRREAAAMYARAGDRAAAVGAPTTAELAYLTAAELSDDEEQAAAHTAAAAAMALRSGAHQRALELLDQAEDAHRAAGRVASADALVPAQAEALLMMSRVANAVARVEAVLDHVPADDPTAADLVRQLARAAARTGDHDGLRRLSDQALDMAAASAQQHLLARAAFGRSVFLMTANRVDEALVMMRWALQLLGEDGYPFERLAVLVDLGDALTNDDRPGARETLETALELARRMGSGYVDVLVCNLMNLDLLQGRWDEAASRGESWLEAAPPATDTAYAHSVLAQLAALRGRVDDVEAHAAAIRHWEDSEDNQDRSCFALVACTRAWARGDLEAALELGSAAVRLSADALGLANDTTRTSFGVAVDSALRLGRLDEAESLLEVVAAHPPGHIPPLLHAQLARFRGLLAAARGDHAQAEEPLRTAVAHLEQLAYPYWHALAASDLASWLTTQDRTSEAEPLQAAAEATLKLLGAHPALARTDRPQAAW